MEGSEPTTTVADLPQHWRQLGEDMDLTDHDAQWYFTDEEIRESPTFIDGWRPDIIEMQRWQACIELRDIGDSLKYDQPTIATCLTYFHRFYQRRSMKTVKCREMIIACLYLGGKACEVKVRPREVVQRSLALFQQPFDEKIYGERKKSLIKHELLLLTTLHFDIFVVAPSRYLLLVGLQLEKTLPGFPKAIVRDAFMNVNDMFLTSLVLRYRPVQFVHAAFHLAITQYCQREQNGNEELWLSALLQDPERFDIVHRFVEFLDLYQQRQQAKQQRDQARESQQQQQQQQQQASQQPQGKMTPQEYLKKAARMAPTPANNSSAVSSAPLMSAPASTVPSASSSPMSAQGTSPMLTPSAPASPPPAAGDRKRTVEELFQSDDDVQRAEPASESSPKRPRVDTDAEMN